MRTYHIGRFTGGIGPAFIKSGSAKDRICRYYDDSRGGYTQQVKTDAANYYFMSEDHAENEQIIRKVE